MLLGQAGYIYGTGRGRARIFNGSLLVILIAGEGRRGEEGRGGGVSCWSLGDDEVFDVD